MVREVQFLVIHGADSAPRACAMLCNLVHLLVESHMSRKVVQTNR